MEIVKNTFEPRWTLPDEPMFDGRTKKIRLNRYQKGELLYRLVIKREDVSVLAREYSTNESTISQWLHTVDAFYGYVKSMEHDALQKVRLECVNDREAAKESLRAAHQQIESVLGILSSKAILEY